MYIYYVLPYNVYRLDYNYIGAVVKLFDVTRKRVAL